MGRGYMLPSDKTEYETPADLFDQLDEEFGPFDLDPAAADGQYSAEKIWARGGEYMIAPPPREDGGPTVSGRAYSDCTNKPERVYFDGLKMPWGNDTTPRRVFLNPPYGREMPKWIKRAVEEIEDGCAGLVVALIPPRTDTKMWQKYVLREVSVGAVGLIHAHPLITDVRFLPGRLKFGGGDGPAPFPSAVVVWRAP